MKLTVANKRKQKAARKDTDAPIADTASDEAVVDRARRTERLRLLFEMNEHPGGIRDISLTGSTTSKPKTRAPSHKEFNQSSQTGSRLK